jgi:hypothetical protein
MNGGRYAASIRVEPMFGMRRREFITLLGGAAAWPAGVRAQQTALPVLGLLSSVAFNTRRDQVAGFHGGLQEAGYVQGKNVVIEYRSANNQVDLLPRLCSAPLLARHRVSPPKCQPTTSSASTPSFRRAKRLQLHWSNAVPPGGGACGPRATSSIIMRLLSAAVAERRAA